MKKILIGLLGSALFAFPVSALESRTFTSADGSKSFKGVLEDYDAKAGIVNVMQEGRRSPLKFKLSLLSEADQEYVELEGPALAASKAVRLDFEIWKDKRVTAKSDDAKTVTTPAGYEIEVRNWTEHNVSDIEIL